MLAGKKSRKEKFNYMLGEILEEERQQLEEKPIPAFT